MLGSHQSPRADLPGAVAALASQVLPVGQEARGPSALERKPGVDEGGGAAVMVHEERLNMYTQHEAVSQASISQWRRSPVIV